MSWLTYATLCCIHALYTVYKFVLTCWRSFDDAPQPLTAPRKQLPAHLALLLVPDDEIPVDIQREDMMENVELVTSWCKIIGIQRLTVYDREGIMHDSSIDLQDRLRSSEDSSNSSAESEPEYPLTPPLSDVSDSRTLTPEIVYPSLPLYTIHIPSCAPAKRRRETRNVLKRRKHNADGKSDTHPITLHLISRTAGKPAMAKAAQHYLQLQTHSVAKPDASDFPSLEDLSACLEGESGLPPPDLMIVHDMSSSGQHKTLELHGFPPWQMRLTEFQQTRDARRHRTGDSRADGESASSILSESEFRRALDAFSSAEMRLGK